MTDPSNVGALSAKMLSVGVQVCENLLTYYSVFDRRVVEQLMVELEALSTDIRNVIHRVGSERFQSTEHKVVLAFRHPIQQCEETIADLRDESEKIIAVPTNSAWNSADMSGYQRIYPLRPSTLLRLEEDIASIRNHMSSALQALQLEEYPKAAHGGAMSLDSLIRTYKCELYFSHRLWFTTGPYFTKWLTQKNSFIWLSGRAGSGKSVLCSTAAHYTFHTTRGEPNVAFGIFFFKFDESTKQDASAMMRSLLLQLAGQCQDCQTDLTRLHASCQPGPPATERSFEYLRRMICRFRSVYIFVDGLDEIRSNEKRKGVLTAVRRMREWCLSGLHLLVTSRDEPAIREILNPSSGEEVAIESSGMRSDISDFLSFKLHTHTSLLKWKTYHDQIQQRLSEHAQGGFRYIECQLEVIKQCPRTASHLYNCLQSLPRDLDEAYDRMLFRNEGYAHDARRILSLLSFSNRPLKVAEVADAYAIDLDKRHFNPEDRLLDIASIKEICGGLVVQMLLHRGADATAQVDGSIASNALQAATMRNHEKVTRILLDAGAEP
ncbi:hypothetical protein F1880_001640 [Penicillium rolfsii]|nr:hypothetical protein F1880_001640 [Penicillium rolfsii]